MSNTLLKVQPSELKMPFELHKQNSCYMQFTNKTEQHVAFKVKTTNPKKYSVRPNTGVVPPGGSCNVAVTMLAPKEIPPDYHCKDKFLVQCVVTDEGTTPKDIVTDMFNKVEGRTVEESKLRVVYIPANPPSPVPEEAEEDITPPPSQHGDDSNGHGTLLDYDSIMSIPNTQEEASKPESLEAKSMILKLTEEKRRANEENQQLKQKLDLLKKDKNKGKLGLSVMTMVIVFILAIIVGYLVKRS